MGARVCQSNNSIVWGPPLNSSKQVIRVKNALSAAKLLNFSRADQSFGSWNVCSHLQHKSQKNVPFLARNDQNVNKKLINKSIERPSYQRHFLINFLIK